jgi:hypothetical protein
MRNKTVLLIAAAILAGAPLSKGLAGPRSQTEGLAGAWQGAAQSAFQNIGLNGPCRPVVFAGKEYQLCLLTVPAPEGTETDKHPWNQLALGLNRWWGAVPFYGIPLSGEQRLPAYQQEIRLAGGWKFCPSTDYAGDGYGIFCVGAAPAETQLAGITFNALD